MAPVTAMAARKPNSTSTEPLDASQEGRLHRNFQGYSTHCHCDLLGLGVSAISQIGELYSQNSSDLAQYQNDLKTGQLATQRGLHCNSDDRIRRAVIQHLICQFELELELVESQFNIDFRAYFSIIWPQLQEMAAEGLLDLSDQAIHIRPSGRLLVRSVCMLFDRYLAEQNSQRFSRVIRCPGFNPTRAAPPLASARHSTVHHALP